MSTSYTPRTRKVRRKSSKNQWVDHWDEDYRREIKEISRRNKILGIKTTINPKVPYYSFITGGNVLLRNGTYPGVVEILGKPRVIMKVAPIIKQAENLKPAESSPILGVLSEMLDGVEITLRKPTKDAEGNLVEYVVTGLECVERVMQATAMDYQPFAKILELKDYVTNPAYQDKFPQFLMTDGTYREPTIDELCYALRILPETFIATFYAAVRTYGSKKAKLKIDASLDSIIDATVENARNGGVKAFRDRKLLFESAGLVEVGGGVNINVSQTNNTAVLAPGVNQGLPQWDDVRQGIMSGSGRELPAASTEDVVEAEIVEENVSSLSRS